MPEGRHQQRHAECWDRGRDEDVLRSPPECQQRAAQERPRDGADTPGTQRQSTSGGYKTPSQGVHGNQTTGRGSKGTQGVEGTQGSGESNSGGEGPDNDSDETGAVPTALPDEPVASRNGGFTG